MDCGSPDKAEEVAEHLYATAYATATLAMPKFSRDEIVAFLIARGCPEPQAPTLAVEGDGYNPFRSLNGQMMANISTPRPDVTEPRDVTRIFKLISAP